MSHLNSTESIQSCSRFGALSLSYTLPSLSYQVLIEVSCPRTQHLNNVPRLRGGGEHDFSLKILHQAGFEIVRQAATSAERYSLTIAPCPSLKEAVRGVTLLYKNNRTQLPNKYKHFYNICTMLDQRRRR